MNRLGWVERDCICLFCGEVLSDDGIRPTPEAVAEHKDAECCALSVREACIAAAESLAS